jgi:hypothetical protein
MTPTCWADLLRAVPELATLERDAGAIPDGDWRAWEALKRRLGDLVGWYAPLSVPTELRTSEAWDCAYRHLLDAWELR